MRHGVLLAQAAPDDLLSRFGCDNLEDVLLTLSKQQEQQEAVTGHENESQSFVAAAPAEADMYHVTPSDGTSLSRGSTMWVRFHALLWRNITWLKRSKWCVHTGHGDPRRGRGGLGRAGRGTFPALTSRQPCPTIATSQRHANRGTPRHDVRQNDRRAN